MDAPCTETGNKRKRETANQQENNSQEKRDGKPFKFRITGIPMRDKVRTLFYQVLTTTEERKQEKQKPIHVTVEEIEEELFKSCDKETGKDYQERFRSLYRNLKDAKNASLREAVLSRTILPKDFVVMTPHELANPELKKEREQLRKESIRESKKSVDTQTFSEEFQCRKCGLRKCSFFQMQTRSADEPMTTFVTCHHCGNRWKQ
ncbi:Putative transcription elongation factor S-II [Galdieria sulphuraria]|uniref:Transcription elongation factor S-II n=1 Tax=Galdieria sulphuraria TaxID=130081 RepID=M2X9V1_GALSU|nr:transcription elongation factor S-II [Galdieria sulphuraria]EME26652.1 transcription elongation factor S-II [Galdieria sulphuraria]GJD08747.1 Putative transcription elongation factor S-II [Galdieria sulphuraria]|eukprot:XP_005703172.1 transcription elongation factor S-II [Galdieria sulphuraria]